MICTIFSVDQMGGFGNNGSMPWDHDPEDMAWFREHTLNQVVVMGRNTWDDPKMPKPLPDRINCVISNRTMPSRYKKVQLLTGNWKNKLMKMQIQYPSKKVFILGGPSIITECLDIIDWAYVTHRKGAGYTDVKMSMGVFMDNMAFRSCRPSLSGMLNFCTYKNNNSK
jgi:dihydrofolate reductase